MNVREGTRTASTEASHAGPVGPSQDGFDRRSFLKAGLGVAGLAASAAMVAACSPDGPDAAQGQGSGGGTDGAPASSAALTPNGRLDGPEIEWEMATSWPASLATLFGAAESFAQRVSRLTGGRFRINPRPSGEIVGGLDVLPAVRDLGAQVGHSAASYYVGLSPVHQFGSSVPFGLTWRQHMAWRQRGGGNELLNEFYASEYGLIAFPAGGSGCQMGGWFTKEINSLADLRGLRMRIPGIGGRVLEALGGEQVSLSGGEILAAIEQGTVDGAEFVGPADDLTLGLDRFDGDLFYYYPGWWEPGSSVEVMFPLSLWNELPVQYQAAVEIAAEATYLDAVAAYDIANPLALQQVKKFAHLREFSPQLMTAFKEETEKVLDATAASDARFGEVLEHYRAYHGLVSEWHGLAERSYLDQQTLI